MENPKICHKACSGKNKFDTKTIKTIQYWRKIQDGGHFLYNSNEDSHENLRNEHYTLLCPICYMCFIWLSMQAYRVATQIPIKGTFF
jgi:hypothetical protein